MLQVRPSVVITFMFRGLTICNGKVKLPAEQEDELKRPAYITTNNAGVRICENRLVNSATFPYNTADGQPRALDFSS